MVALSVDAHSTGNALSRSYFDRSVTQQGIRSVHAEFDFAYDVLEPSVAFGCVTNLVRSAPFGEARLSLELDDTGFAGAGGFGDNSGPGSVETETVDLPPAGTWTHVSFDLALASDGFVESKFRVDTLEKTLPRYLPAGSGAFDGVHVLCGVIGLRGADSRVSIYLKSLVVIACKPP
jgi:hypothetical protein